VTRPLKIMVTVFPKSDVVIEVEAIEDFPDVFVCEITGDGMTPRLALHGTAAELLRLADHLVTGLLEKTRADPAARADFNLALDQAVGRWQTQIVEAPF
jgi:hypothetical protein